MIDVALIVIRARVPGVFGLALQPATALFCSRPESGKPPRLPRAMVFIIQLVYVHLGKDTSSTSLRRWRSPSSLSMAASLLRLRPTPESVIARSIDAPYEIHLVRFPRDEALAHFTADEERQRGSSATQGKQEFSG